MKIGILSDTHDHLGKVDSAISEFNARGVEEIVHCGDFVAPFVILKFKDAGFRRVQAVFGNNDGEWLGMINAVSGVGTLHKAPAFVKIAGLRFAILHEPMPDDVMEALPVDVVCYGHTHGLDIKKGSRPLIINPGECCGWLHGRATAAVLDSETLGVEVLELK